MTVPVSSSESTGPVLSSSSSSTGALASKAASEDRVSGLILVFESMEPQKTYSVA